MYEIENGVTQTILGDWVNCRQKCWYRINGFTLTGQSFYLDFGNLFHACLEVLYTQAPAVKFKASKLLPIVDQVIRDWLAVQEAVATGEDQVGQANVIAELLLTMLPRYLQYYQQRDSKLIWLGQESEFDLNYRGFRLRGKRDGLCRMNKKELWLLETKTKGQFQEGSMEDVLQFDFQSLFYITASEIEFEKPVNGVIYNLIRRPQLKRKESETPQEYADRVGRDIDTRPEFYFQRYQTTYLKVTKKRFAAQLLTKLREFSAWLKNVESWTYKNESACLNRGGACSYLQACASDSTLGLIKQETVFPELAK